MAIENINVRYFTYESSYEDGEIELIEISELEFLDAEGSIEYERHTIFANGVNQICLTKNNIWHIKLNLIN